MRTSVKTTTAGIGLVAAAAIGVALLGATAGRQTVTAVPELVAATDSVDAKTRAEIVRIAERELNSGHKLESAGDCNYYSSKMGKGCQAWCADFTRYVWDQAGAKITGTNSLANSFRTYGMANKTWKKGSSTKKVKPGDAVTYRLDNSKGIKDDHVGIVTKVDKNGRLTVISGNSGAKSDRVSKRTILDPKTAQITGYASPVGKNAKAKGDNGKSGEKSNKSGTGKKPAEKKPVTKNKSTSKSTATPKPGQVEPIVIGSDHLSLGN